MYSDMQGKKRLFVAIDMPYPIQHAIASVQHILKKENSIEGKFVDPHHAHLTLVFVGLVPLNALTPIIVALQTIHLKPFTVQLGPIDFFMKGNSIRIIFLTLLSDVLPELAKQIKHVMQPWLGSEENSFVSHVTVVRVKKVYDVQELHDRIHHIDLKPVQVAIDSFVLKESVVTPHGVEYSDVHRFILSE
jgi:2'-5' RNA ligase